MFMNLRAEEVCALITFLVFKYSNEYYKLKHHGWGIVWQWSQVGWMLTHHKDGLVSSSSCLILDSSVGLWVGIHVINAGDLVPKTLQFRILHSAEENNTPPFDSKISCLCQSMKINNNRHVYRQSHARKPISSAVKRAECSLIIGTGCWVQVFTWSSIAQSICE